MEHVDKRVMTIKGFGESENDHTFEFIANSGGLDRVGEILVPDGCDFANWMKNPVMLWAHDDWSLPIARGLELNVADGEGLVGKGKFASEEYEFAATVEALFRGEFLSGLSVRFMPLAWETYEEGSSEYERGLRRRYTEWELLEISVVDIPCDPAAVRKAFDGGAPDELRAMLKTATTLRPMSPTRAEPEFRKSVSASFRSEPTETPVVSAVREANWRKAAGDMARLLGACGGLDLVDEDRKRRYEDLAREYESVGRSAPELKQYGPREAALAAFGITGAEELAKVLEPHIRKGGVLDLEGDGLLAMLEGNAEKSVEPDAAGRHIIGPDADRRLVEVLETMRGLYPGGGKGSEVV